MINIYEIWRKNRETFYVFCQDGTKEYYPVKMRYLSLIALSFLLSIVLTISNDNIIIGVITAQSILVGFAFNVMVYVSSQDALKSDLALFRESKIKAENINILADEIFYNLSYFVTIALLSVVSCLVWITIKSDDTVIKIIYNNHLFRKNLFEITIFTIRIMDIFLKFIIIISTIESGITFSRLVRRVTFHFQERRHLLAEGS